MSILSVRRNFEANGVREYGAMRVGEKSVIKGSEARFQDFEGETL
jgi:hypothetical protein